MPTQSEKYIVKKSKKKKKDTKMTYLDCLKKNFFFKNSTNIKKLLDCFAALVVQCT